MSAGNRGQFMTSDDKPCPSCGVAAGVGCTIGERKNSKMIHPARECTVEEQIAWHASRVPLTERLQGRSFIPGVHYANQAEAWMREAAEKIELEQSQREWFAARLEHVANAVDHWPDHPWIPGVTFARDGMLSAIVREHRTMEPYNNSIPFNPTVVDL